MRAEGKDKWREKVCVYVETLSEPFSIQEHKWKSTLVKVRRGSFLKGRFRSISLFRVPPCLVSDDKRPPIKGFVMTTIVIFSKLSCDQFRFVKRTHIFKYNLLSKTVYSTIQLSFYPLNWFNRNRATFSTKQCRINIKQK